jgi:hypothetical protein
MLCIKKNKCFSTVLLLSKKSNKQTAYLSALSKSPPPRSQSSNIYKHSWCVHVSTTRWNTPESVQTCWNPSKHVTTCRNTFQSVQICPDPFEFEPVETRSNLSKHVRTRSDRSKHVQTCWNDSPPPPFSPPFSPSPSLKPVETRFNPFRLTRSNLLKHVTIRSNAFPLLHPPSPFSPLLPPPPPFPLFFN